MPTTIEAGAQVDLTWRTATLPQIILARGLHRMHPGFKGVTSPRHLPRHLTFWILQWSNAPAQVKNEVQMPYNPQLSGAQMSHCKFNLKVKIFQLSTSPVHSGPINLEHNSHFDFENRLIKIPPFSWKYKSKQCAFDWHVKASGFLCQEVASLSIQ